MATNVFGGREADIQVSATSSGTGVSLGALRNYEISVTRDPIEATSFDSSGWREIITGIGQWTVTSETLVLSTAATHQQDDFRSFLSSETRRWFRVINSTGTGSQTFQGYGYVAGWTQGGPVDGIQLHNFTVEGDGKLVES